MARKHKKTDFLRLSVLSPYLKRYWKSGVIMALTGILVSVIDAILPLFNRYAIDHFVKLQTLDTIVWFILLYIALLCVQALSNYMTIAHCARVELMVDRDILIKILTVRFMPASSATPGVSVNCIHGN